MMKVERDRIIQDTKDQHSRKRKTWRIFDFSESTSFYFSTIYTSQCLFASVYNIKQEDN